VDIPGGKGKVVVSFAVHTDGTIGEFEVLETAHPLLAAEALRVLKLSGKWKPAIFMNQPVEWRYTEDLYITQVKSMKQ
jgi:outer membrane biosynthesis protein TonB